jgi:hypothetical protein
MYLTLVRVVCQRFSAGTGTSAVPYSVRTVISYLMLIVSPTTSPLLPAAHRVGGKKDASRISFDKVSDSYMGQSFVSIPHFFLTNIFLLYKITYVM